MSEAELHLIRARLDGGLRNKAARGELVMHLPAGFERDEDDRIVLCADEQVRHAIERVFELWRRAGSARQVVGELIADGQRLPRRSVGERRVRWVRASYGAVHKLLTNPVYAGAFVFGRTRQEKHVDANGELQVRTLEVPIEEWSVCMPDHHPGYVSWEEYLANRQRLRGERETARRGRRRRARGRRAAAGRAALRTVRPADAGRVFRQRRPPRAICVRARVSPARHRDDLPDPRRRTAGQGGRRGVPRSGHPGRGRGEHRRDRRARPNSTTPGSPVSGSRWSAPSSKRSARERQFDACEPENRLVAQDPGAQARGRRSPASRASSAALAALEHARPAPLTDAEREALTRLARDLPQAVGGEDAPPTATARNCCAR